MNLIEQRQQAEERMKDAKAQFTKAAKAALAGDPCAPGLAREAFRRLTEAQAVLRGLDG